MVGSCCSSVIQGSPSDCFLSSGARGDIRPSLKTGRFGGGGGNDLDVVEGDDSSPALTVREEGNGGADTALKGVETRGGIRCAGDVLWSEGELLEASDLDACAGDGFSGVETGAPRRRRKKRMVHSVYRAIHAMARLMTAVASAPRGP